jgi:hypothetical protein
VSEPNTSESFDSAPSDERAEVLAILTDQEPTRLPTCHGYQNCCSCPRCLRRAQRSGCACECHIEHPDALGHCDQCRQEEAA